MDAAIVVTGLRRSFGRVEAVRDVSLYARPGAVTGLVGPNGSGKTTLFLMLASLLAPDAGTIRIGDIDPVEQPHAARAILGWMPDALGIWGALSARETLIVTGRLHNLSKDAARARADELLELVELTSLAKAPARVLSRGQKQRLGLARALVHDPRVLLLDEPASGLDPAARVELRHLLRRFAAEGRTVLVSSHVLAELEEVIDDAVFLVAGSSVDSGTAIAARRTREWRVRLLGQPPDSAASVAAALEWPFDAVRVDRADVIIALATDDDAAGALRRLVERGVPVSEFAPAVGDLEQTFLDLRGGELS